jgi:hypothetical protein
MRRDFFLLFLGLALVAAALVGSSASPRGLCMPGPSDRTTAFRSTVVYNLGAGAAGADPRWNPRTTIPTLATLAPIRALAARRGWAIDAWLFNDGAAGPLEACQGRWRPAVNALAFPVGVVASVAASERDDEAEEVRSSRDDHEDDNDGRSPSHDQQRFVDGEDASDSDDEGGNDPEQSPMVIGARRRRATFASHQAAIDNYAAKPPLNGFTPDALRAYVVHGFAPDDDGVHLKGCGGGCGKGSDFVSVA